MKTKNPPGDRVSHLIIGVGVGILVFALVILVAVLVHDDGTDKERSTGRCAPAVTGTVDPVTCQPYAPSGAVIVPPASGSGSSAQRPQAPAVKAPAVKAPPAPKAPAAPPRVSLSKR
ncbi:hypothetical protein ABZ023_18465 [Streptomyces sp. NPDC006367]|uniref:hypothetical protein n=1 Tax=unclassified Streptomyces TaxID=2593676 RepID=UPI0033AB248A